MVEVAPFTDVAVVKRGQRRRGRSAIGGDALEQSSHLNLLLINARYKLPFRPCSAHVFWLGFECINPAQPK
jgi:hypothetical protein